MNQRPFTPINPRRIALIGFGEVGQRFGKKFLATGQFNVAPTTSCSTTRHRARRETARALKIEASASAAAAIESARIIFSCVTATAAKDVADEAAHHLVPGQFFVDINSVSPETKRADAAAIEPSGADYVECTALAAILNPTGMKMEMASEVIGQASAIKTPLMAAATAERQDWLADEAAAAPELKAFTDEQ